MPIGIGIGLYSTIQTQHPKITIGLTPSMYNGEIYKFTPDTKILIGHAASMNLTVTLDTSIELKKPIFTITSPGSLVGILSGNFLSFYGSIIDINAALSTLLFNPPSNYVGSTDYIKITASDGQTSMSNKSFPFTVVPKLILHFDANDVTTIIKNGTDVVTSWTDLTHGKVATTIFPGSTNSSQQVKYVATGLNGKPTLVIPEVAAFSAGTLSAGYNLGTGDVSVFVVMINIDGSFTDNVILGWSNSGVNGRFLVATRNIHQNYYTAAIGSIYYTGSQVVPATSAAYVMSFRFNRAAPSSLAVWRNNMPVLAAVGSNWSLSSLTDLTGNVNHFGIGGRGSATGVVTSGGEGFNGSISEIKVFHNKRFTDTELLAESLRLQQKWGIS
jgi:hypothetical protein